MTFEKNNFRKVDFRNCKIFLTNLVGYCNPYEAFELLQRKFLRVVLGPQQNITRRIYFKLSNMKKKQKNLRLTSQRCIKCDRAQRLWLFLKIVTLFLFCFSFFFFLRRSRWYSTFYKLALLTNFWKLPQKYRWWNH